MTPAQIKNIHIAKSQLHLAEEQYRLLLANVAGVASCKLLTQAQYEDCMAVLEDMGYQQLERESPDSPPRPAAPNYWRQKVATRGTQANARLINKICTLYADYCRLPDASSSGRSPHSRYSLAGLVRRVSQDRTPVPDQLTPHEAYNLIEALKAILARTEQPATNEPKKHESISVNSCPLVANLSSESAKSAPSADEVPF